MTNGAQWYSWLIHDYWFNELPASLQNSLLEGMRQRRVTPGRLIFGQGEPACGFYALLSGSIRFNDVRDQQEWLPPAPLRRPYWFGEVSLFDDRPRRHDVYAEDHVILLQMPQRLLAEQLQDHPRHWRPFRKLLEEKLGVAVPPVEEVTLLPTNERVAFRLLLLAEGYGPVDRSSRIFPESDVMSARGLGLTADVVERVLGEFARRGIIERGDGFISVFDVERLRKAAWHRLTESTL